ncbi:hypothetical protein KVV02_005526 [Mortierella alpina]|uniref:BZIP domain-containing protein n=1 Tax=Mortierella alpina TaxID=64518 RepID=A0A9P8CVZ5_MORAP|nr:hypothetical protein KVV02_005526 [Mortierella alpina]
MLQSLMVFPNNNDFFQVGAAMLDDNVAKLMNTDEIDNYLTSASTSPIQDYLMAPSNAYHPQQQNQRQHQLQFSSAITATTMPPMVPHSAPSSPSYPIIKSEDVQQQQHNMEQQQSSYTPAAHPAAPKRKREESGQVQLLPRQTSPQLTIESSPATSAAAVTANHNVNVLENSPSLTKTSAATAGPCSGRLSTSSRLDKVKTTRSTKITKSSFSSTSSSSSATEMITSTAAESKAAAAVRAPKKTPAKKANNTTAPAASESRESSQQPENGSDALASHLPNSTGNITHPRRAAQNRAAQRTFRNRRKAYIKELEHKVQDMDRTRELMESIHLENQEVWRRLQILEALASQSGLQVPTFPAMTPALLNSNNNAMSSNGVIPMGSSNDDDEEDEDDDMSDAYTQQHAQ